MNTLSDHAAQPNDLLAGAPGRRPAVPIGYVIGAVVFVLGIMISVAGFRGARTMYESEARLQFEVSATQRTTMLSEAIGRHVSAVEAINRFFAAGNDVARVDFVSLVEPILHQFPAIRGLGWVPMVQSGGRDQFEAAARGDGLADFRIFQLGTGGKIIPAEDRAEYFPVAFIEPFDRNRLSAGLDLASNPALLAVLDKARDSGRAVAARTTGLVDQTGTGPAFLLFVPLYRAGISSNTVAQRRASLRGFGFGVFGIRDIVANALESSARPTGIDTYVFDADAPPSERLLAFVPSPLQAGHLPLTESVLSETRAFTAFQELGGQTWKFVFSPAPGYFSGKSIVPVGILCAGLLISLGLCLAPLFFFNRIDAAEGLLAERTVELRKMTQQLAKNHSALQESRIETQEAKERLLESLIETKEAKERLLDALEASPSGLVLFDKDDRLVLFNSMAEQMNLALGRKLTQGMDYAEYERLNLENQFPDAPSDEIDKKLSETLKQHRALIKAGTPITSERKIRSDLWIRFTTNRTAEGGSIGILTDITDLKRNQENLELQANELKRSNQELEQFAYLASHDMQEPLRVIASFCDLLQLRYAEKLDDDGKEFIGYAVDGARRMRSLLDDLLTYSRVGRSEIKIAPVPLAEVLSEIQGRLRSVIEDENAALTYDDLPTVRGDQTLITQLLQNLIGNGIKFHGDEAPRVHISAEAGPDHWTISVSDNGIGIEPQYAEKVFQMFQRLHGGDSYPGNGLGLALCKRAVERHGGTIWIEPTETSGTTIKFTLPN